MAPTAPGGGGCRFSPSSKRFPNAQGMGMAKDPKRVAAGKRSREKGKTFERLIARKLRERFAGELWVEEVRRSDQTHKAHLSDVTGWPYIWCECETAEGSNPVKKLEQAELDIAAAPPTAFTQEQGKPWPVAVCREKGSPTITATLRLSALVSFVGGSLNAGAGDPPVTVDFDDFLDLYAEYQC